MTRAEADDAVIRLINSVLPEYDLVVGRLRRDNLLGKSDRALLVEAKRLLEEAAGRLMLRDAEKVA